MQHRHIDPCPWRHETPGLRDRVQQGRAFAGDDAALFLNGVTHIEDAGTIEFAFNSFDFWGKR